MGGAFDMASGAGCVGAATRPRRELAAERGAPTGTGPGPARGRKGVDGDGLADGSGELGAVA